MGLMEILALFAVMAGLALVPSASVALVIARSSSAGFTNGCAVAAGIVVGDLVFVLCAILGMAALAEAMGAFFLILRYLAGAYLIWFGIGLMKASASMPIAKFDQSRPELSASFFSGLLLTLGDIKAIFFYASLFPAFVDLANITEVDILMISALTVTTVGGAKLAYAYFATAIVSFAKSHRAGRALKVTAGGVMTGSGLYLIAKT